MDKYEVTRDLEIPNVFQQIHRSNAMKHDGQNWKTSTEIERLEMSARVYDPASF